MGDELHGSLFKYYVYYKFIVVEKENNKKNISIIFPILREEMEGYKDIDHILPFLYFLSKSDAVEYTARGIIFENKANYLKKNIDQRIELLSNLKNVDLEFLYKDNFLVKIKQLLELKNNSKLAKLFFFFLNKLYIKLLKVRQKNFDISYNLGENFINSKLPLIITLHSNYRAQEIVSRIKKINKKAKWMILPHGTTICDNIMVLDTDLDKDNIIKQHESYNKIDYFASTSKRDLENAIAGGLQSSKGSVIGSPRYCKEWLKVKSQFELDGKEVSINNEYKVKILFLIPKKHINIFSEELIRTIDFISSYQEIELILLHYDFSFPKLPIRIADRVNIRHYVISKEYSTSKLIDWADIVFHVGTGVLFESFIKEKITVLPRYLTSNTLICDKYNAGYNLSNRDELRDFCNTALTSINELKKQYKEKCEYNNKKFIDDFVYANTTSISQNIIKTLSSITNKINLLEKDSL